MRGLPIALLALAACNPGVTPVNQAGNGLAPVRDAPQPPANQVAAPANTAEPVAPADPEAVPGVAGMSPYRRREYERGWRDCMTGNFDPERQGESYRIGCMAAEDAKQRRSDR